MLYQSLLDHRCFSKSVSALFLGVLLLFSASSYAAPEIVDIKARSEPSQIKIDFNMPVSPWSAIAIGNYYISDGVRVLDARLSNNRKSVLLDTTPLNENGTYRLIVFNLRSDSDSDTQPPMFNVQTTDDPNILKVVFNQPVNRSSAENSENYFITNDIDVVSATLSDDYMTVELQVAPALPAGSKYTLVVKNISRLKVAVTPEPSPPKSEEDKSPGNPDNPLPDITLMADSALIEYNSMARISWEARNATSCVASGAWSGYKPVSGSRNIGPLKGNSVFFLTCRGPNGSATKFITVSVLAAEQPTLDFSANKTTVAKNSRPVISWSAEGATDCTASGDWSGDKPPRGSEQLDLLTDDITLFLTCRGAGGSTMQSLEITVAKPPVIMLRSSKSTIGYLGITTLNWYVTDAESCIGSGTDTGASPPTCGGLGLDATYNQNNYYNTSEWHKSPLPTQGVLSVGPLCVDTTFFLTCTGPGGTTTDFVEIKVLESQPDIRLNADRAYAKPGDKITLTWETLRVNSCTASGGWSGSKTAYATNSEMVGTIDKDTVFTLTCQDSRGRTAERSVTVRLKTDKPVPAPDNTNTVVDTPATTDSKDTQNTQNQTDTKTADTPDSATDDTTSPAPTNDIQTPPRSIEIAEKPVPVREYTFETTTTPTATNTDDNDNKSSVSEQAAKPQAIAYEWQIASDKEFKRLVFKRTISGPDKLTIPDGLLKRDTDYWIRTRQQESDGTWSEWSDIKPFKTQKYDANDLDSNDTDDQFQMVGFIDTNNNDIDDKLEGICNIYDAFQKSIVGIKASQGRLRCLSAMSEKDMENAIQADGQIESMPHGLFNFRIEQLPTDGAATTIELTFYFEKPLPSGTIWYQYDKTTDRLLAYNGTVINDSNKVTLTITDGGTGDSDGVINGVIVSPLGPVIAKGIALNKPVLAKIEESKPSIREKLSETFGIGSTGMIFLILLSLALIRRKR